MPFKTLKITPFLKHGQNMSPLVLSKRTICKHRRKKKVKLKNKQNHFRPCFLFISLKTPKSHLASFILYVRKISRKTNIYPVIRTCTCAYQVVRNVSFSENFAYVRNAWSFFWCFLNILKGNTGLKWVKRFLLILTPL